jgi:hypothetical protein
MIVVLSVIILVMFPLLIGTILRINKLKQHIELLDREQHTQNKDIIELLKYRGESSIVILQHSDVLTYLCDQDPLLNKIKMPISTIVGQA